MTEIRLELTCSACPEQYDAYLGDVSVGYLRLRWGHFRVDYPECGGETIYEATFPDDPFKGEFEDEERDRYLEAAKTAIRERLKKDIA
jgi:hypothetical protein